MTLKVNIDEYQIISKDSRQYTVGKPSIDKNGYETLSESHYFPTLALAAVYLRDKFALKESIATVEQMNEIYERTTNKILEALK